MDSTGGPMRIAASTATELYLDLLMRSLTNTLYNAEPNHDNPDESAFVTQFALHYMRGGAISMLPLARLKNIRFCIGEILNDNIPGDLIETGVWRGGATILMRALLKLYGVSDRNVWVADSFEGLPQPDPEKFPREAQFHDNKVTKTFYQRFASHLEEVQSNFRAYDMLDPQVRFLKGWFKDTLPIAPIAKLALMRLDGDYYESTMDALTALYDKLSVGGFVIIDDYGEDSWTYCRKAVDEFRESRSVSDPLIQIDSKCVYWRRND
jgi:hypothetical protein